MNKFGLLAMVMIVLAATALTGCDVGAPASTSAATGSDGSYTSAYLDTSYPEALPVTNQLMLGTMKLEGTTNAVTPEQAKALLPLWQAFQGSVLRDNAERNATLVAIEKAMTPAQLQAIAAMQLTGNDLQVWTQEQGLGFGPPTGGQGAGPSTDARATAQARFGTMTEAEREAMRATAQAGGGFPGGGGRPGGGQGTGRSSSTGASGALLNPLIALLTQRAGGSTDTTPISSATPTPAQSPSTPTPTATATSEPTPTATPVPTATVAKSTPAASSSGTGSLTGKLVIRAADGIMYVVNVDGTGLHALTAGIDPSWSPDGKRIAFVRWWEPWGLFVINADGTEERQLVSDKDMRQPDWSPNGDVIAVVKQRLEDVTPRRGPGPRPAGPPGPPPGARGSREIWVGVLKGANPDTGGYHDGDYPADRYVQAPSWAPDGVHLVYGGKQGIYITAKGEDPRLLTSDLQLLSTYATPAWSPLGDHIAYASKMHGYWEIWSMRTDGSDQRQLTAVSVPGGAPTYNNVCPTWSPDGQYIAYLTDRSGEWEVWAMRADGSDQHKLLDLPMPLTYAFNGDRMLDWGR